MTQKKAHRQPLAATRDGFGRGLLAAGKKYPNVWVVSADLSESTRVTDFAAAYPKRFVEVGVAEQNALGVAAGLSFEGVIPFVCSFAVFSPGRTWDQLRVSVCYSNANVKIVGHHTGVSVGADGATHQALEDVAITRCLPNLTVIVPADAAEAERATLAAARHRGPVYLRLGREPGAAFTNKLNKKFTIGKANILRRGRDVTIIGCGPLLERCLQAADILHTQGVSAEVINCHTIKPLDAATLLKSVRKTGAVVTVEEHQAAGGLGSAVAELLAVSKPTPQEFVAMPNQFGQSGAPQSLLTYYGFTARAIVQKAHRARRRAHR